MPPAERWKVPTLRPRTAASRTSPRRPAPISDWKPHIGRKVSIRYRLHEGEHPSSEAIGVVMTVSGDDGDQLVKILSRRGVTIDVPTRDVIAAKLFPV